MPVLEWDDIMCFAWAILFLVWGFRFRNHDNGFVTKVAQKQDREQEKVAKDCSRICFINAFCLVVVGIAAIMDWTAVMLTVFFGMVAYYMFGTVRAWWKDAEENAQNQDDS